MRLQGVPGGTILLLTTHSPTILLATKYPLTKIVLTAYYHLPLLPHQACSHKALGGEALVKKNNQRLAAHEAAADALVAEGAPDRTMWASASGRAMEASAGGRAMEEEFE